MRLIPTPAQLPIFAQAIIGLNKKGYELEVPLIKNINILCAIVYARLFVNNVNCCELIFIMSGIETVLASWLTGESNKSGQYRC